MTAAQNAIPSAINIRAATMQDIGPAGRQIQHMKQAAIRMVHHRLGRCIDCQTITPHGWPRMRAEAQIAIFVMDHPIRRWREGCLSRQPAANSQPCIADPPRDAPLPGQKASQVLDRIGHAKTAALLVRA